MEKPVSEKWSECNAVKDARSGLRASAAIAGIFFALGVMNIKYNPENGISALAFLGSAMALTYCGMEHISLVKRKKIFEKQQEK